MITHYGYRDASGEYFIAVDSGKCTACGKCLRACPQGVFEMTTVLADLEDRAIAGVRDERRRQLRLACGACDHRVKAPCETACEPGAIAVTWYPTAR